MVIENILIFSNNLQYFYKFGRKRARKNIWDF